MMSPFVVDGRKKTLSVTESRRGSGERVVIVFGAH
jgi:hypothetical protein